MQIVNLQTENVKRIKAVQIKPDGSVIVIGGKNGAGKSSIIDSIMYALAGDRTIPDMPIREGQSKAEINVDLGEYVVTKRITPKGSTLVIKNSEGEKFSSPQAMLDKIVGKISCDPLEFSKMSAKKQAEVLMGFSDFDFQANEEKYKEVYDERTAAKRLMDSSKHQLDGMKQYPDAPEKPVDSSALYQEISAAKKHNNKQSEINDKISMHENNIRLFNKSITENKEEIESLKEKISKLENDNAYKEKLMHNEEEDAKKLKTELDGFVPIDVDPLENKLASAFGINSQVEANNRYLAQSYTLAQHQMIWKKLDKELKALQEERTAAVAGVKFPIEGLGFNSKGVFINRVPFDQCSSAEQLKVSVAVALALNPKLKVLLIRDGSLLDEESMALIAKMVEEAKAQVWIERVGSGKEVTVEIEDGQIKENS